MAFVRNIMGLTLSVRHYWSGVNPTELLLLNPQGHLVPSNNTSTHSSLNQNYNQFAVNYGIHLANC
jgi:hypothetical protein